MLEQGSGRGLWFYRQGFLFDCMWIMCFRLQFCNAWVVLGLPQVSSSPQLTNRVSGANTPTPGCEINPALACNLLVWVWLTFFPHCKWGVALFPKPEPIYVQVSELTLHPVSLCQYPGLVTSRIYITLRTCPACSYRSLTDHAPPSPPFTPSPWNGVIPLHISDLGPSYC